MSETAWRTRIVGHGDEVPQDLLENPANWRIHPKRQQKALEAMLDQVGWVRHVIVNKATGHLIDGHLRVRLAVQRGEPTLPVVYVDLTEAEERLILASLDPIAALAAIDTAALSSLAAQIDPLENKEVAGLVRNLAGLNDAYHSPPSQETIDQRSDELEHRYDGATSRTFETKCPHCEHEFGFAK